MREAPCPGLIQREVLGGRAWRPSGELSLYLIFKGAGLQERWKRVQERDGVYPLPFLPSSSKIL